jgi:hypothetical protein
MSRQKISLNNLSGPDSRDLSVRYPADMIRVSAWYCQNLSEVPACCLGIDRGRLCAFYLPVLPLYGFTKFYTNPFLLIYLLLNFKLPVLILIGCLEQKKIKIRAPTDGSDQTWPGCRSPDRCQIGARLLSWRAELRAIFTTRSVGRCECEWTVGFKLGGGR